jgi:hypothetical protein
LGKVYKFLTLEDEFLLLKEATEKANSLSIKEILIIMKGKGRSIIMILLVLPFCQPFQIPGLSTPFGLVIAFLALRSTIGKGILFPKRLLDKKIEKHTLDKMIQMGLKVSSKLKFIFHQRLNFFTQSPLMKKINGLSVMIAALFLALPLPIPLSNLIAAWSILWINMGVVEDDGFVVLVGYFFFLVSMFMLGILISQIKIFLGS